MIYTFYSYKGGVGRSMALVNIAELMYKAGLKVMMVDWDLEAPGLERFYPHLAADILERPGVMEMLATYKERALRYQPDEGKPLFPVDNIWSYAIDLHPDDSATGKLWLVPAGYRAGGEFLEYANRVKGFDWKDFYENWAGESYIDWLREHLEASADVILVDSRTGVTEMGGVCAYQLADVVVMLCAANEQNLDGTLQLLQSFTDQRLPELRHGRPLTPVVIPARIERTSQLIELNAFRQKFNQRFADYTPSLFKREKDFYQKCEIPYVALYAFEELIAVDQTDTNRRAVELEAAYETLLAVLASLAPDESTIRQHLATSLPDRLKLERHSQAELQAQFEEAYSEASSLLVQAPDLDTLRKADKIITRALALTGFEQDPRGLALQRRIQQERNRHVRAMKVLEESDWLIRSGRFNEAYRLLDRADVSRTLSDAYQSRYNLARMLIAAEQAEASRDWRSAFELYHDAQMREKVDRYSELAIADTIADRMTRCQKRLDDDARAQQLLRAVQTALERFPRDIDSARTRLEEARELASSPESSEYLKAWELLVRAFEVCESAARSVDLHDIETAQQALGRLRTGPLAEHPLLDDLLQEIERAHRARQRLRAQHDLEDAIDEGRRALEAGNLQSARLSFENALKAEPGHVEAKSGLMTALSKMGQEAERAGRKEEALAYYEKVLLVDPNSIEIQQRKRRLENTGPWRRILIGVAILGAIGIIIWIVITLSSGTGSTSGKATPTATATTTATMTPSRTPSPTREPTAAPASTMAPAAAIPTEAPPAPATPTESPQPTTTSAPTTTVPATRVNTRTPAPASTP